MVVEASNSFYGQGKSIQKIISINPEFQVVSSNTSGEKLVELSALKQAEFFQQLQENARKFKIELVIFDPSLPENSPSDYFNDLLPLKEAVMQNMRLQEVESDKHPKKSSKMRNPPYRKFRKTFQLPTRFSHLTQKYGTPYFALHGLISAKYKGNQLLYYTIWVNVESSEIIYREIRVLPNKARPLILNTIIYDSFHIVVDS